MPNTADATVTLSLTGASPPDDTWKQCKNANGDDDGFWYKFTGGNTTADDGSWEFDTDASGNSNKFIDININAADGWNPTNPNSQGYRITSVPITYDGGVSADKQDISIQDDSNPRSWQLKDKNKDKEIARGHKPNHGNLEKNWRGRKIY